MLFHVPFYIHELIIIISFFFFVFSKKKLVFPQKNIIFGAMLLLLGTAASLWLNTPDKIGLGILKSWFLFPILMAFLLFQYFQRRNDKLRFFLIWFFVSASVAFFSIIFPMTGQWTYDGRLKSFFLSPNHLAMFLEPGFLLGAFFLSKAGVKTSFSTKKYAIVFSGTIAIAFAVVFSRSDAALLALLIGGIIFWVPKRMFFRDIFRKSAIFLFPLILVASVCVFIEWPLLSSGEVRSSFASRIMIWNASEQMIIDHPFFGIGPGRYEKTYLSYQYKFPQYLEWAVPHPHNIFFAFWLYTGVFGLLGFLLVVFSVMQTNIASLMDEGAVSQERRLHRLFMAFFVVILIHGLVDTPYFKNEYALFFWIFVAFSSLKDRCAKVASLL